MGYSTSTLRLAFRPFGCLMLASLTIVSGRAEAYDPNNPQDAAIRRQYEEAVRSNRTWAFDQNGNLDQCKIGIPSPDVNLGPDQEHLRAQLDKQVEECHQRTQAKLDEQARAKQAVVAWHAQKRAQAAHDAELRAAYLEKNHLTPVSVLDLQANGKNMVDSAVFVHGYITILNEDNVFMYTSPDDVNGVRLDLSNASSNIRRFIFSHCSRMTVPCQIEVPGTVAFDQHVFIHVD